MESILVIGGGGYMGSGIVQACAQAGYQVFINDVSDKAIDKSLADIEWSLKKLEGKKIIKEPAETVLSRIKIEKNLEVASSVSWVIETIIEIEELKLSLFKQLDSMAPVTTHLATNTSTIPISRIAKATKHPERVVGIHFFNPVPLLGLIEVIKGDDTSPEVFDHACQFAQSLGKRPVRVNKDMPGFVFNRIWHSAIKEAVDLVSEGIVTAEDVDFGLREGYGWKRGPFAMLDESGIDTNANVDRSFRLLGEKGLAPRSSLLDDMVKQGRLGKKVGRGFYEYSGKEK